MQAWLTPANARTVIAAPIPGQARHNPLTGLGKFPESTYRTPDNQYRAEDNPAGSSLNYQQILNEKKQGSTSACDDTVWQIKAQQLSFQVNQSDTNSPYNDAKQPQLHDHSNIAASEETCTIASALCSTDSPPYHTESAAGKVNIADGHSSHGRASNAEAPHVPVAGHGACSKLSTLAVAHNILEDSTLDAAAQSVSAMVDDAFSKTSRTASASNAGQKCERQGSFSIPIPSPCTPASSTIKQSKPATFHSNRNSLDPFLTRHMCLQQLEALWGQEPMEVGVPGPWLPLPWQLPFRSPAVHAVSLGKCLQPAPSCWQSPFWSPRSW